MPTVPGRAYDAVTATNNICFARRTDTSFQDRVVRGPTVAFIEYTLPLHYDVLSEPSVTMHNYDVEKGNLFSFDVFLSSRVVQKVSWKLR